MRAVRAWRVGSVGARDAPDAGFVGIDVIQLVHDGVALRKPSGRVVRRLIRFSRTLQRLIAKTRQHERDEILPPRSADLNLRRFRDEPFRSPGPLPGRTIAPEV